MKKDKWVALVIDYLIVILVSCDEQDTNTSL